MSVWPFAFEIPGGAGDGRGLGDSLVDESEAREISIG